MEAMDQLLVACHAQTLNLFVESFLKMVQKLLESTDPQLQILATQSVFNLTIYICSRHQIRSFDPAREGRCCRFHGAKG